MKASRPPRRTASSSRPGTLRSMTRRKKGSGVGQTIGSMLAGFDQQVFRTTPPPHELVKQGARQPAVPAEGGGMLSIELPEDRPTDPTPIDDSVSG